MFENMESAGAEEFGWLKSEPFSVEIGELVCSPGAGSCFDDSPVKPFASKDRGGRKVPEFCGE